MALTKDDLVIGNTVYYLKMHNNMQTQRRLTMIDSEGNQWSRYDKPRWTYSVSPMVICGNVEHVITGKIDENCVDDFSSIQYHMEHNDEITMFYEWQLVEDKCLDVWEAVYASADEAEAAGETFCVNKNGV